MRLASPILLAAVLLVTGTACSGGGLDDGFGAGPEHGSGAAPTSPATSRPSSAITTPSSTSTSAPAQTPPYTISGAAPTPTGTTLPGGTVTSLPGGIKLFTALPTPPGTYDASRSDSGNGIAYFAGVSSTQLVDYVAELGNVGWNCGNPEDKGGGELSVECLKPPPHAQVLSLGLNEYGGLVVPGAFMMVYTG